MARELLDWLFAIVIFAVIIILFNLLIPKGTGDNDWTRCLAGNIYNPEYNFKIK